ncbi:MAG: hypothetical protein AAF602_11880 [Myxococcota bacterium]
MLFSRTVWSDWRLLLAVPVAIALRFIIDDALFGDLEDQLEAEMGDVPVLEVDGGYIDYGDDGYGYVPEPSPREPERLFPDHAYRPESTSISSGSGWSLDALSVALAGGGLVFALGGFMAYRIWREAEAEDASEDEST